MEGNLIMVLYEEFLYFFGPEPKNEKIVGIFTSEEQLKKELCEDYFYNLWGFSAKYLPGKYSADKLLAEGSIFHVTDPTEIKQLRIIYIEPDKATYLRRKL